MIHRKEKFEHFTQVDNGIMRTSNISLTAKGLLVFLLTHPDNWKFTVPYIERATGTKRTKLMTALNELEQNGFLERKSTREKGKFVVEFDVYEVPNNGVIYDEEGFELPFPPD